MSLIVETTCGKVEGIRENQMDCYKYIPYAAPPVGPERRFKPPIPHEAWDGVLDCTKWGAMCPQVPDDREVWQAPMSEDCLYLNVYTPATDRKKRPVYVYIHGGAFQTGAHNAWYTPDPFVRRDIVCVSCNYRLGALGFFQLDEYLGEEYKESGNSGMLDIIMALQWIQENIDRFGGDKDNVTIMGESAGSKLCATLLVMSKARGLFQKVVMESGSTQCIRDIDTAHKVVDKFIDVLGLTKQNAKKLLTMPWETLIEKQGSVIAGLENLHSCGPVFDGINFEGNDALEIIRSGNGNPATILGGFNRDEYSYYYNYCNMKVFDQKRAEDLFGRYANYAMRTVKRLVPDGDDHALIDVLSKYIYGNATIQLFDAYTEAGQGNAMYLYRFDWDKMPMGAHHGIDTAFVMGDLTSWAGVDSYEGFWPLSNMMMDAWEAFIRTGKPEAKGMPQWPAYTQEDKRMMRFDIKTEVIPAMKVDLEEGIPHQIFSL